MFERIILSLALTLATTLAGAAPAGTTLLFGINEGTSGSLSHAQMQEKYQGLMEYLGRRLKRPVKLESGKNLDNLSAALQSGRYDLLLIRPSHLSAKAMRDHQYSLAAAVKGDAITYFIVGKDSPLKKPADIAGRRIAMPDELAYPTRVGLTMLREQKIDPATQYITHSRSQEAVGFAVENGIADVGVVVSYSRVAKEWQAKGGRFLWESRKLPYWSVIASPTLEADSRAAITAALVALDSQPEGADILKRIGIAGFHAGDQQAYLDLLKWLGE